MSSGNLKLYSFCCNVRNGPNWSGKVAKLTTLSSLASWYVLILIISDAANDENFINIMIILFSNSNCSQWRKFCQHDDLKDSSVSVMWEFEESFSLQLQLSSLSVHSTSQIAKFMGPTWGPPGSCQPQMGPMLAYEPCYQGCFIIPPASTKLKVGYTGFTSSVRLSGRLWTKSCPLCIFHNASLIHFIFACLIKQLQKVCCV